MSSKEIKEFVLVPKAKWEMIYKSESSNVNGKNKSLEKSSKCPTSNSVTKDTTSDTGKTTTGKDNETWIYY